MAAFQAANKISREAALPAKMVIRQAQDQLVKEYGYTAYLRPKMWALFYLRATLSEPLVTIIFAILAVMLMSMWLFGWISVYYSLFFVKSVIALIINTIITMGNAIWFAMHGLSRLLITAFTEIINGIAHWFVGPLYDAIGMIWNFFGLENAPTFTPIGQGDEILIQPTHGFSYVVPDPIQDVSTTGSLASLFSFTLVRPGSTPYTENLVAVYQQNGAVLYYPEIDEEAVSPDLDGYGGPDFWAPVADRPPDSTYAFDIAHAKTWIDFSFDISEWLQNAVGDWIQEILDPQPKRPESWRDLLYQPYEMDLEGADFTPIDVLFEQEGKAEFGEWEWFVWKLNPFSEWEDYAQNRILNYVVARLQHIGISYQDDSYQQISTSLLRNYIRDFIDEKMSWW